MTRQDRTVDIFCNTCVKAGDQHWLHNPISVTVSVWNTCRNYTDSIKDVAATCRLYMEADKRTTPRWLRRLYKQIADFLTQAGVPADYCPDSEHKVQSGAKSLAIIEGVCVFFEYRKPIASVRLTYPELWACILKRMMLS